ncbi:MAG: hypothetical protein IKV09_00670 [Alistipes sp.]|nr:hypothetical protein [Alistipes sp.]
MKLFVKIATLVTLLLATLPAQAQKEKVVEQSNEIRPEWIGRSTSSTIAVTEVAPTLAEAQERALNSIRQHIINSVAVNISSSELLISRQVSHNGTDNITHDYTSALRSEAAKLPFVSNISLSNASDIYWVRIYSKKSKEYRYEYSVCYPFDKATRTELVNSFLTLDKAKSEELERLRKGVTTITDLDGIVRAINSLEELHSYFFDQTRRNEALAVKKNYLALYSQIGIEVEEEAVGNCIYSLRISGRRVTTSIPVRLKSESAMEMTVKALEGNRYQLTYNPEYASPRDINTIEIVYPFGAVKVARTIRFEAPKDKR